ncbi:FadR/GntR family transcriptional regulator [Bosea sp. NPDC055332]
MARGSKPGKIGTMVAALGAAIVRGEIASGTVLPPEPELAERYGAGRSVVREAVKILVAKGLLTVRPRHGTQVRPQHDWTLLDREVLGWMRSEDGLDRALLLALEETREIIEPEAAALAATRATPEDLARIRAALAEMETGQDDPQTAIAADKRFHLAILDATNNPILRSFRGAIDTILSAMFDFTVDVFAGNLANHAAVVDAIAAGQPEHARQAMRQVLGYTRGHMLSSSALADGNSPKKKTVSGETP